jgi:exopolysaccharide biosynthesis polyprenyl glycosylphosphotransferase
LTPTPEADDGEEPAPAIAAPPAANVLTRIIVMLDVTAVALAWSIVLEFLVGDITWTDGLVIVASVAAFSVAFGRTQRLYQARACTLRSEEKARLMRVVLADALVVVILAGLMDVQLHLSAVAWGTLFAFLILASFRSAFRHWLTLNRARGRYLRPIVIVGDNDESARLVTVLVEQPELGFQVLGYVGCPPEATSAGELGGSAWLGPASETAAIATRLGATGVLIVVTSHSAEDIDELTRGALDAGLHVHLSTGLQGVTHTRLRVLPVSFEPLIYVEAVHPSSYALAAKRLLDVVIAGVGLLLALPVLALAGLAIKLTDRGPVFFSQQRIGRYGEPFTFYKLRTMTPGSDSRLDEVSDRNTRRDGPLFKDPSDPRRTRVGRVLEAASIDELPQFWNVLRGDMSLVGPRPALPHEVAQFDDALLRRHAVRPGITGLWQVEGRDNPHFLPYRRLDLVYVENFSLALDAVILSLTLQIVIARAAARLFGWDRRPDRDPDVAVATPLLARIPEVARHSNDVAAR